MLLELLESRRMFCFALAWEGELASLGGSYVPMNGEIAFLHNKFCGYNFDSVLTWSEEFWVQYPSAHHPKPSEISWTANVSTIPTPLTRS
jgi:hypothetical protein